MPALAVVSANTATRTVRQIVHRSRGQTHGPITRLMSPGDLGEVLKPFVFLDLFDNGGKPIGGFGPHPPSGIATLTSLPTGTLGFPRATPPQRRPPPTPRDRPTPPRHAP